MPAAVAAGSEAALRALAATLAEAIAQVSASQVAPLARQLRDTLAALDAVVTPPESRSDDLAAAWARRRSAAQGGDLAG